MKKRYEHIGILPLGLPAEKPTIHVEPGDTFEFDLEPKLESFLFQVGLIREISPLAAVAFFGKSSKSAKEED